MTRSAGIHRGDIGIDHVVMMNVAQSAMDDIWRYKVFHLENPGKYSYAVKRVAYFSKWLLKLRPIHCRRPQRAASFVSSFDKIADRTLLLNESFCLYLAQGALAKDAGLENILFTPRLIFMMEYDMHYRDMNDTALLAIFQLVKDMALETTLIETLPA